MKLAVITSGFLPVPATKGGAVENLIVNLLNENETNKEIDFTVFSIYDEKACEEAKIYNKTEFVFIKSNILVKFLDNVSFWIAKNILKKRNSQSYRYIFQRLHYLRKVSKLIKYNDYDKVLLENHPTQYLALKWRRNCIKYKDRYYYHCHNEFPGTYGCDEIIKNTKLFLCVSDYISNSLSKYLDMPMDKFFTLKNCIDTKKFSTSVESNQISQFKRKMGISDETVLLFSGRLVPEKGIKELLDAISLIKEEKFKLLVVGASLNDMNVRTDFEIELNNMIKNMGKKVVFTGFVNYSDMPIIYAASNISIVPSIWDDPAPLTIIESLVTGLPIITTGSGGIKEYVNDRCAIIVDRNDKLVQNMALAIKQLINDKAKIDKMSKESLKASKNMVTSVYYNNFKDVILK